MIEEFILWWIIQCLWCQAVWIRLSPHSPPCVHCFPVCIQFTVFPKPILFLLFLFKSFSLLLMLADDPIQWTVYTDCKENTKRIHIKWCVNQWAQMLSLGAKPRWLVLSVKVSSFSDDRMSFFQKKYKWWTVIRQDQDIVLISSFGELFSVSWSFLDPHTLT